MWYSFSASTEASAPAVLSLFLEPLLLINSDCFQKFEMNLWDFDLFSTYVCFIIYYWSECISTDTTYIYMAVSVWIKLFSFQKYFFSRLHVYKELVVFLLSAFTNILTEIPINFSKLCHFIFLSMHSWPISAFTGNRIHGEHVILGLRIIISGSKKRKLALKFETVCFPSTWNSIECKWRLSLVAVKTTIRFFTYLH